MSEKTENSKKYFLSIFLSCIIILSTSLLHAEEPDKNRPSIFSNAPPEIIHTYYKNWFALPVTSGKGMFNPVFLPFEYTGSAQNGSNIHSLVFPCLLSFKFDFVPYNISSRHPGFIFNKAPETLDIKSTDKDALTSYIKGWDATHCITGGIIENTNGFSGYMAVYDKTGKRILGFTQKDPIPYFSLMGEMVSAWLDFQEKPASQELKKELIRPMTSDMETLRLYADTFTVEWRSEDEWQLYERILELDPNFGELQYWYANQRFWEEGNAEARNRDYGIALLDHIVIPALTGFNQEDSPYYELVENYKEKFNYARALIPNHPELISQELEKTAKRLSNEELDLFLPIAQEFSFSKDFLEDLAGFYFTRFQYEKALPLIFSALNSGYLLGSSTSWNYSNLCEAYSNLGYYEDGFGMARGFKAENFGKYSWIFLYLAKCAEELFMFDLAANLYNELFKKEQLLWPAFSALRCVYESGNNKLPTHLEDSGKAVSMAPFLSETFESRKVLSEGNSEQALSFIKNISATDIYYNEFDRLESEIIRTEAALIKENYSEAFQHATNAFYLCPRGRRVAYLLEKASKNKPDLFLKYVETATTIFPRSVFWLQKNLNAQKTVTTEITH